MKLLELYKWIAGGMPDFTKPFQENEQLYKQAQTFWSKLENINADSIDIPGARNILGRMVLSAIQQQTRQALFAEILGTIPHSHLCCDFSRNVRI